MDLVIDLRKSLDENASYYFEKAKKARKKIDGALKAIELAEKKKSEEVVIKQVKKAPKLIRKKAWFEKFKWFFASNGMLVIGGRDATTNEIIIKKHMEEKDIVFHTEAPGSPFVVIKTNGLEVSDSVLQEAADFCASHSRAWKLGLSSVETYWVFPDQVSKEAKAGEYMSKGSFMVYGKRNYLQPRLELFARKFDDKIMIAPLSSRRGEKPVAIIKQGDKKASDAAKLIIKILSFGEPDDVIPNLPSGSFSVNAD